MIPPVIPLDATVLALDVLAELLNLVAAARLVCEVIRALVGV